MPERAATVPYDSGWPGLFASLASRLRAALGGLALRIDHVGPTAVPGLAARPVVDVQVSVETFDEAGEIEKAMSAIGFEYRSGDADKTQLFFRGQEGPTRAHVHFRKSGSFQEAFTLLFRDYLRSHPADARAFEENKSSLSGTAFDDRLNYVNGRGQTVWSIVMRAKKWGEETSWKPGAPDA